MFSADVVAGRTAAPLKGDYSVNEAVNELLRGSDLSVEFKDDVIFVRGRSTPPGALADRPADTPSDIVVTGSRIRGAPVASSTITLTQSDIRNAGHNTVAEAMRAIPQNFGGGQNPGIGSSVPLASGVNTGGASTINLRGLGSGATLTLLNGHRLAYNVTNPAVDISAIPLDAVERVEIVADGASALYGSDAVAGVANIVLKRDFSGASALARIGASTDGGNVQQQYSLVAGTTWTSGGLIATADFERDTAVMAGQRSYARAQSPALTLYPFQKHHSGLLSGHQDLLPNLSLAFDTLYNHRSGDRITPFLTSGDFRNSGVYSRYRSTSFAFAPSLTLSPGRDWEITLSGMVGGDRTHYGLDNYAGGGVISQTRGCYCNKARSAELGADGTLVNLPGGPLKLAGGVGYRTNDFHGFRTRGAPQNIHASQKSYYGYSELSVPLIGPDQSLPFIDRLTFSAAARYEDYPGIDRVATPKLGLIYAPSADLELKGSWGRSFKAPSLWEQYQSQIAYIEAASDFGARDLPPSASVILLEGGNPSLKPERATTWSTTLAVHPRAIDGFRAELTYFSVRYKDRIAAPITFETTALADTILEDVITLAPSEAAKEAALSNAASINNLLDQAYDPADVVAIIDNSNHNVARQTIHGIDLMANYDYESAGFGRFQLTANAAYLLSHQQLNVEQPVVPLAGTVFNPPHWRARAGVSWVKNALTVTSFANYTGSVRDVRQTPATRIGTLTTFDVTARYALFHGSALLRDIDLALSVQNVFNAKPPVIRSNFAFTEPYDSTNYAPFGRFLGLAISKHW
jgi:outer membrane receptor protein involved in Fe transport